MFGMTRIRTHADHILAVYKVHGKAIQVVGTYVAAHRKIEYRCDKSGHVFLAKPANVVHRRSGCRLCYNKRIGPRCRKSNEVYKLEAEALGAKTLDRYMTALTPIRHQCSNGHVWSTSPNQLLSGYGCPLCDRSQYRRRPIRVGDRTVWVQGAEGKATDLILSEGTDPDDIAFSKSEGKPTFRYLFKGRTRRYVPDFFILSKHQVVEVKSTVTLGLYDPAIFAQVKAKARSVIAGGYGLRLMIVHRGQNIDLGLNWYRLSWRAMDCKLRRIAHAQDRRARRK